jgi:hypothetical protein
LGIQDFIVNAVDANWYPIPGVTDVLGISSSDTSATLPTAGTIVLVNGVATVSNAFAFSGAGSWTITASDVTDGTKLPNTSSPVVVQ